MEVLEHLTVYCYDRAAQRNLLEKVRRMHYDEALVVPGWRLEYRLPLTGFPHYLLVRTGEPVALQYIRAPHWLNEVQVKLSHYLVLIGFKPQTVWRNQSAMTPLSFEHNRLPWMFEYEGWDKREGENVKEDFDVR